jgi:DNA-binding XRE family transcriptional regulator
MSSLKDYRVELGWTPPELARQAKLNRQTIYDAERGKAVRADTAKKLASALSKGLKRRVKPSEIEGLKIL